VIGKGVHAPLTPSGKLIVDNVLVSTFVAFGDSSTLRIAGYSTGFSYHWLEHTFELAHSAWCTYLSSCENETYTSKGISNWADLPYRCATWWLAQNIIVKITMFALSLSCLCFLHMVHLMLMNPPLTIAMLLVTAVSIIHFSSYQLKTKSSSNY
jgi:uncharacterized protein YqhQ